MPAVRGGEPHVEKCESVTRYPGFPDAMHETVDGVRSWRAVPTGALAHSAYRDSGAWRRRFHEVYRRHVRVRPQVLETVDAFHANRIGDRHCVGLHIRSPGHAYETAEGRVPSPERYLAEALRRDRDGRSVFFLASDDAEVVAVLEGELGDRLIVRGDVKRIEFAETGLAGPHEADDAGLRDAADVLIDALLLSRCDVLVHGVSNVATAVGYIAPDLEMVYVHSPTTILLRRLWMRMPAGLRLPLRSLLHRARGRGGGGAAGGG